jgi:uncharacterized protein
MLPLIEKLIVVQHRDKNIIALEKKIANVPLAQADLRDRVTKHKSAVSSALSAVQEVEKAIKKLELEVQTRRATIEKLKFQQFQTKKNEEFQTMGAEILRYEADVIKLEDQEIELMEKSEELRKVLLQAREELSDSEAFVETDIAALHQSLGSWQKEMAEEIKARGKVEALLDDDLLTDYRRIFKSKNGNAVVGLVDSQCSGCHMKVTKSTQMKVKAEQELTYCENCGRILYWWTDSSGKKSSNEY